MTTCPQAPVFAYNLTEEKDYCEAKALIPGDIISHYIRSSPKTSTEAAIHYVLTVSRTCLCLVGFSEHLNRFRAYAFELNPQIQPSFERLGHAETTEELLTCKYPAIRKLPRYLESQEGATEVRQLLTLEEFVLDEHWRLVSHFYGNRKAKRSQVLLINHIWEGIKILRALKAPKIAWQAFCLHPLVQADKDLATFEDSLNRYRAARASSEGVTRYDVINPNALAFAMEYRHVANEYLSRRTIVNTKEIRLSTLKTVNQMLIADKVQNKRDFDKYHKGTHPRSAELSQYFDNWLKRLKIGPSRYAKLIAGLL